MIRAVVGVAVSLPSLPTIRAVRPFAAVILLFSAAVSTASASSRWATLEAIHKLENPQNSPKPGRHGELGAYQFRSMTWRMHTSIPFSRAINRETSDSVAVMHYEWLKKGLEAARKPATPYNIALAWNGGLSAAISGRSPRAARDYAQRAMNLAASYEITRRQQELFAEQQRKCQLLAADLSVSAAVGAQ